MLHLVEVISTTAVVCLCHACTPTALVAVLVNGCGAATGLYVGRGPPRHPLPNGWGVPVLPYFGVP